MTDNYNNTMKTNNQSTEGKDPQQTTSESSLDGAACSPLFIPVSRRHGLGQNFECGKCGMLMLREREEGYDTICCAGPRCGQRGYVMKVPLSHPEILPRYEPGKTEIGSSHSSPE